MPDPKTSPIRNLQAIVDELRLFEEMYLVGGNILESGILCFHNTWAHFPNVSKEAKKIIRHHPEVLKLLTQVTNYGKYYLDLEGNPGENLRLYKESLRLARRCGDQEMEAIHLSFLGEVYDAMGKSRVALRYHHKALVIAEALNDTIIKGIALYGLCWSYYYQDDFVRALDYCRRSLTASQELGIQREISHDLATMGLIYSDMGKFELAISTLRNALEIDRAEGDSIAEGATMGCLGETYLRKGNLEAAEENILGALTIEKELEDIPNLIDHLLVLGDIYIKSGILMKAIKVLDESLGLSVRMMRNYQQANAKELLSQVYFEIGDVEKAIALLTASVSKYNQTDPKKAKALSKQLSSWKMEIEDINQKV